MKPRRSSGVACRIRSSCPCPTITCISRPSPESESSSWMSSSRHERPLIAYSEPPERKSVREIVTSEYSIGSAPSALSMVSETCARPRAARPEVPAKMTSSIFPPRSDLAPCSPITQARASTTLDLPDPLGPTTAVTPGSKSKVVAEAKDLKPRTVSVFKCTPGVSCVELVDAQAGGRGRRAHAERALRGWERVYPAPPADPGPATSPVPARSSHFPGWPRSAWPGRSSATGPTPRAGGETCQNRPLDWAGPTRLFTRAPRLVATDSLTVRVASDRKRHIDR